MGGEMAKRTKWVFSISALAALWIGANVASAQEYRGRIQGVITDPSQAVIVGAKVTLANVSTGVVTTQSANESGHYLFDLVEPGSYTLSVEAAGFSKFVRENIIVQSRADLTLDAGLKTGNIQETVDVKAEAVAVQFNSSNLETTVDSTLTNRMPQYNHSAFLLAQMDPSVIPATGNGDWNPYNSWGPVKQSVGGGKSSSSDLQVDGSPTNVGVKNSYQPIADTVGEVNVQQNSVDAEFGHSSGSAITMTTKAGSNQWHGLAYYQGQYPWANALDDRVNRVINLDRKTIYGGTLGHPILRNKLFNFVGYEGWKYIAAGSANASTFVETMPTDSEKKGDYSQSLNSAGGLRIIYDPWTTVTSAGGAVARTPFPGNVIPTNRIDPVAAKYASLLWEPNAPGIGPYHVNNFSVAQPTNYPYKNFSDRVDYNVTDKLRAYARVGIIRTPATVTNPTGSSIYQSDRGSTRNATDFASNVTYTVNPTTVLTLRGDYHSFVDASNFVQASGAPTFATFWPSDNFYGPVYADPSIPKLVPRMSILDPTGTNQWLQMGAQNGWWNQTPNGETVGGTLSKQEGKHFLKAGAEFRLSQVKSALTGENPGFGFDPAPTSSTYNSPYSGPTNLSGDGFATFLLGAVATVNAGNQTCWACGSTAMPINIVPNTEDRYYAVFVNDDWKISKSITLNLGLRYDHTSPFYEAQDRMTAPLDLTTPNPIIKSVTMPAAVQQYYSGSWVLNGAYQFESGSTPVWNNRWGSLAPRIGVAYRLNDKTSLRAAWGRYFTPWEQNGTYGMEGPNYYGFDVSSGAPPMINGIPQMNLSNPFPSSYPLTQATGKSLGANTGLGDSISFVNPDRPLQHSDRFNVGVQRELPGGIVADVTFFLNFTNRVCDGDYTGNCFTTKNLDMMDPRLSFKYQAALNQAVPNPFYGLNMPGPLANQPQVAISSLMVPYPQYTGLTEVDGLNGANMHYESLQIKIQKRYSRGLSFLGAYNYHREQDQVYYDNVAQYLNSWTWSDGGLARHRLTISGSWDLPFGRGRGLLNNANKAVNAMFGGWVVTSIVTYQSGVPIKFTGVTVTGNPGASVPAGAYFNPAAIAPLAAYTEETNPWYYPGVNGPGLFNMDASIVKDFHPIERVRFSLRMDAFNVLNNINWAPPAFNPGDPSTDGRSFGVLNNTFGRKLQLGLRLAF
jgi:Carboxypeptidase regulatory-like domain/TonB dependent receptor